MSTRDGRGRWILQERLILKEKARIASGVYDGDDKLELALMQLKTL